VKITEHFSLEEFAQPARHGLPSVPYPERWIEDRLRPLCLILEEIRREVGAPLRILSGYRSPEYNRKIGGARASQHVEGRAADIVAPGLPLVRLETAVLRVDLAREREGRQRVAGWGSYPSFVHVDVRPGRLARWTGARVES
jgi:uncharacterized protein YcbK (DUF882 family)